MDTVESKIDSTLKSLGLNYSKHITVIKTLCLCSSDHQLCLVHLQRNVRNQMDKEDSQVFNKELKNIKENSLDYDDGLEKLDDLCSRFKSKYPNFIKHIQSNKERYLCFLKYPESLRKHIYTTNPVESVNSMIEKVRINLGGYFQSVDILEVNLLIQRDNLKNGKWKKPIPAFKGASYEICTNV